MWEVSGRGLGLMRDLQSQGRLGGGAGSEEPRAPYHRVACISVYDSQLCVWSLSDNAIAGEEKGGQRPCLKIPLVVLSVLESSLLPVNRHQT